MKRIITLAGIFALAILFMSAISIRETPQDPPRGKKAKKHIKMVKVGDDGKRMEIDTVLKMDEVLIWNGDTINGEKALKWISEEDFDMDFDFDFDVEKDGKGNVFIMKSGKDGKSMVHEFKLGDDCEDVDIMKWHDKGDNEMFLGTPHAPKVIRIEKHGGNVIDLSDPGIISYEKKDLKNGKEKITIVREKPLDEEIHEEIIMHGSQGTPMFISEGMPRKTKQIKVIADDGGKVEILEDGKVWSVDEMEEGTKVIEKDGKKIIIKKSKKGGEMKVDVEVEEHEKEEQK